MVTTSSYIPSRGDIIWLNFTPQAGYEQAGKRPACVLSPRAYNERVGLAICCPITNRVKGYPFEVQLPPELKVTGVILSDQVKSLDWQIREASFIEKLPIVVMTEVLSKLNTLLK